MYFAWPKYCIDGRLQCTHWTGRIAITKYRNGQKLLNVVWACDLRVGNELSECIGRWTWGCGEKRSVVDYILVSREVNVHRMIIEDEGAMELGSEFGV